MRGEGRRFLFLSQRETLTLSKHMPAILWLGLVLFVLFFKVKQDFFLRLMLLQSPTHLRRTLQLPSALLSRTQLPLKPVGDAPLGTGLHKAGPVLFGLVWFFSQVSLTPLMTLGHHTPWVLCPTLSSFVSHLFWSRLMDPTRNYQSMSSVAF